MTLAALVSSRSQALLRDELDGYFIRCPTH